MMREAKHVAWLAGLLEGEGYFRVKNWQGASSNARPNLEVALQMTDRDVVERASKLFPCGQAAVRQDVRSNPKWQPTYRYSWTGRPAWDLMTAILPYMGERRAAKIRECLTTPNLSHQKKVAA